MSKYNSPAVANTSWGPLVGGGLVILFCLILFFTSFARVGASQVGVLTHGTNPFVSINQK